MGIWEEIQLLRRQRRAFKEKLKRRREQRQSLENGSITSPAYINDPPPIVYGLEPIDPTVERKVMEALLNPTLQFPLELRKLASKLSGAKGTEDSLKELLEKLTCQGMCEVNLIECMIMSVDLDKLSKLAEGCGVLMKEEPLAKRPRTIQEEIDQLLSVQSVRETESKKMGSEVLELLNAKSVMEQLNLEKFQSAGGSQLREFCSHKTKDDCRKARNNSNACAKLHFRRIIQSHTDGSLGDCSFLNTCFHMETCKFVHYSIDDSIDEPEALPKPVKTKSTTLPRSKLTPAQWVKCDMRFFDVSVIGKFAVIMADPPWDIHMELPYGTMSDDEMRQLNIPALQDDGHIFLWVTGRAMELGRECLTLWGYERVDELIWVKTNQLQRLIRTGRTGHWINHGKEHCLVGVKGNPTVNRGIDTDIIVAEVRATSHKPDEIYGVIERLSPGTRKVELFGRQHNCQPNWLTLGNQLDGIKIVNSDVRASFYKKYPRGELDTMAPAPNFQL